jgi:hypothetical protein
MSGVFKQQNPGARNLISQARNFCRMEEMSVDQALPHALGELTTTFHF